MKKKVVGLLVVALFAFIAVLVSCKKEPEAKIYKIGDIGPAGGYIFYDCDADNTNEDANGRDGLNSDICGWRYLEAAPTDLSSTYPFGYYRTSDSSSNIKVGTDYYIGDGWINTENLVNAMGSTTYVSSEKSESSKGEYAAKACADYTLNGYDDWFLPSFFELSEMYMNLFVNKIGFFANGSYYLSSSETDNVGALVVYFKGDYSYVTTYTTYKRSESLKVRPVRAFK